MREVIGVGDMKVSDNPETEQITFSLGSCIGVIIHDPAVHVGGMLHFMLPDSAIDKEKGMARPFMFADTGIPRLFKAAYKLGAKKNNMKVVVVGGSRLMAQQVSFDIGKRNYLALRKIFFKNNVMTDYEDVGGNVNRTVRLLIRTGDVFVKTSGVGEIKV